MNILCKKFGHAKVILWCQQEGWRCIRPGCGEEVIYREKPIEEWARALPIEGKCPTCGKEINHENTI